MENIIKILEAFKVTAFVMIDENNNELSCFYKDGKAGLKFNGEPITDLSVTERIKNGNRILLAANKDTGFSFEFCFWAKRRYLDCFRIARRYKTHALKRNKLIEFTRTQHSTADNSLTNFKPLQIIVADESGNEIGLFIYSDFFDIDYNRKSLGFFRLSMDVDGPKKKFTANFMDPSISIGFTYSIKMATPAIQDNSIPIPDTANFDSIL